MWTFPKKPATESQGGPRCGSVRQGRDGANAYAHAKPTALQKGPKSRNGEFSPPASTVNKC